MIRLGQADFTPTRTQIVDTIPPSHLIAVPASRHLEFQHESRQAAFTFVELPVVLVLLNFIIPIGQRGAGLGDP